MSEDDIPDILKSPQQQKDSTKRKPGAQPGNSNSLQHGFYSRHFRLREKRDLDSTSVLNLRDEIAVFRVHIRRLAEMGSQITTLAEEMDFMRVLSLSFFSLSRVVKIQHFVTNGRSEFDDALEEAIALAKYQIKNNIPDSEIEQP